jgi:hypothetical protein
MTRLPLPAPHLETGDPAISNPTSSLAMFRSRRRTKSETAAVKCHLGIPQVDESQGIYLAGISINHPTECRPDAGGIVSTEALSDLSNLSVRGMLFFFQATMLEKY